MEALIEALFELILSVIGGLCKEWSKRSKFAKRALWIASLVLVGFIVFRHITELVR